MLSSEREQAAVITLSRELAVLGDDDPIEVFRLLTMVTASTLLQLVKTGSERILLDELNNRVSSAFVSIPKGLK